VRCRLLLALTLIGWYLMTPPLVQQDGQLRPDSRAPFSEWQHVDSYDSADACRQGITDHLKIIQRSDFRGFAADKSAAISEYQSAECIGTDDPRLKGN
jgi:hypothetical protein